MLNAYAVPLDAWIPLDQTSRLTGVVCGLWRDNGERSKRPKGRFRFYLDAVGVEAFRAMVEERFGPLEPDPGSVFNQQPRNLYGIQPQKQPGLNVAGLHVPVGRLSCGAMQELARLSRVYGCGEVRFTEDQNALIPGIPDHKLAAFSAEPFLQRYPLHPQSVAAGTVSCTGSNYCGFALTNTKDQAMATATALDEALDLPQEVKIHWTGCPNSCGQAYMGAIGLTGTKAKTDQGMVEAYDITLGGSQGSQPSLGELVRKRVPKTEVNAALKELLMEHCGATPKATAAT